MSNNTLVYSGKVFITSFEMEVTKLELSTLWCLNQEEEESLNLFSEYEFDEGDPLSYTSKVHYSIFNSVLDKCELAGY